MNIQEKCNPTELRQIVVTWWNIWLTRNQIIFNKKKIPHDLNQVIQKQIKDWDEANSKIPVSNVGAPKQRRKTKNIKGYRQSFELCQN